MVGVGGKKTSRGPTPPDEVSDEEVQDALSAFGRLRAFVRALLEVVAGGIG